MRIHPMVLGNGSEEALPWQQIHATTEELLDMFSMQSMSYQRKVVDQFFPEFLVML
jgi:hypothetical protein